MRRNIARLHPTALPTNNMLTFYSVFSLVQRGSKTLPLKCQHTLCNPAVGSVFNAGLKGASCAGIIIASTHVVLIPTSATERHNITLFHFVQAWLLQT